LRVSGIGTGELPSSRALGDAIHDVKLTAPIRPN
jgi:hypothetical protein